MRWRLEAGCVLRITHAWLGDFPGERLERHSRTWGARRRVVRTLAAAWSEPSHAVSPLVYSAPPPRRRRRRRRLRLQQPVGRLLLLPAAKGERRPEPDRPRPRAQRAAVAVERGVAIQRRRSQLRFGLSAGARARDLAPAVHEGLSCSPRELVNMLGRDGRDRGLDRGPRTGTRDERVTCGWCLRHALRERRQRVARVSGAYLRTGLSH